MNDEVDEGAEARHWAVKQVQSFLKSRLERAERAYGQALTSLWVGNAGAALATLSFIGATWKSDTFPKVLLWPLGFFVFGVISMGVGALLTLVHEKRAIERIQRAESPLDLCWDDIESPLQSVGLTLRNGRTAMALLSGACFIVGCVVGFLLLAIRVT